MTGDQSQLFSISREFDFVRLDGLRRATGTQEHDWDLYVVKELVDNALDADESQWNGDPTRLPRVSVVMDYVKNIETHRPQLIVRVTNAAAFPVAQLAQIFATTWYTSRKSCVKDLTRGTLGNALKTLLGIPYALRHRLAHDWSPDLKPMTIVAGGREYQPQYRIDVAAQRIQFVCDQDQAPGRQGTQVSVGIDEYARHVRFPARPPCGPVAQPNAAPGSVSMTMIQGGEVRNRRGGKEALIFASRLRELGQPRYKFSSSSERRVGH